TITEWGHVTYQRTLFKYYDPNKLNKDGRYGGNRFVFLLDAEMGRKPYQRIHFDLYIKVLKELDSGKRYQDIIDKYKDSKITPMTVSNIFRSIDLAEINENFKHTALHNKIKADSKYIYLGLDDTFTKIFKRHKKIDKNMVRLAYLHTGIDWQKSTKKRHFSQNKRLLTVMSKNVNLKMKEYRQLLKEFINNNYDLTEKSLIVMGDGAEWIKKIAEYFKSDYILDEFHLMAKVHRCFNFRRLSKDSKKVLTIEETQKKAIYQDLYAFVRKGEVDHILDYLKPFLTKEMQEVYPFLKDKKDKVKELIKYITTNANGIRNYQNEYYIGCQTESQISYNVKALKSYGAKAYSEIVFRTMLSMRMAKVNQWSPIQLIINEHIEEVKEATEYYRQNMWFHPTNENYDYEPKQGSVPILKSKERGITKLIRKVLSSKN
ncbi:Mbov_0401 family ICE element transposase-like protein, partial [Spiroplasma sp. hyd1]|uniref:Mbov_0401 family ICE element transposase-like protein n=1 Tax=Spiroplasma sp. hyd1 TaxID=1609976 RepID=UPI0018DE2FE5